MILSNPFLFDDKCSLQAEHLSATHGFKAIPSAPASAMRHLRSANRRAMRHLRSISTAHPAPAAKRRVSRVSRLTALYMVTRKHRPTSSVTGASRAVTGAASERVHGGGTDASREGDGGSEVRWHEAGD